MEDKNLTEKESLELIARMIRNTKDRLELGQGNVMLLWGYLSLAVAALVFAAAWWTRHPACMWLWFLIPLIGFPAMMALRRKQIRKTETFAVSYVDKISAGLWKLVGFSAGIGMMWSVVFMVLGYDSWIVMFIFAFFVLGFADAVQGVVIREKSLVVGGAIGMTAGGFVCCCAVSGVALAWIWALPLYMAAFIAMFIIPGHLLNRKAERLCSKN